MLERPLRRARRPRREGDQPAARTSRAVAAPTSRVPRAPRPANPTVTAVSTTATMLALVAAWVVAQMLFLGGLSQQRAQAGLYDQLREELAAATAPVGPVTDVGRPVALLTIPHLGLEQVVVEGTASGELLDGPGHQRTTVLPGQEGTSVVMGRATTYGGPFKAIADLRLTDQVTVVTAQGRTVFKVIGIRRPGDPLPQPRPDGAARLVLVSAEGEGRLSALAPEQVVYVDAQARKAFPAPAGLPTALPDPEQAMGTEPGALPLLALCLGLLLAMTLGVVAARQRWSAATVWVITAPVVIAVAWVTTDVVMRLLPNLL